MSISFKTQLKILAILFVVAVFVWIVVFSQEKHSNILEIDFFAVGQGDAIFIETPDKKQVLIDGGPDLTILEKLGREMPFWDRSIDLIVLSHPEADHLTGLIEVIKRYKIGGILTTGVIRDTPDYQEWFEVIKKENIPIFIAQADEVIKLNNYIKLNILYPFENLAGTKLENSNNTSMVAQLVYGDFEVLLTGDIEKKAERTLINSGINLKSDVLKIAHHGSKTSTTEEFLKVVSPVLAVIQVGKDNSYGHPHQNVLDVLSGINVFRTDLSGDIEILTDGVNFRIR